MAEFLKFAAAFNPLVTWILVVVGWLIVSRQHNSREARKEVRAKVDSLVSLIYEAQENSVQLYMKPSADTGCALLKAQILRDVGRIGMLVSAIEAENLPSLSSKVTALRRSITLHDFDQIDRPPKAYSDTRITEITDAAKDLAEQLELRFRSKYSDAVKI